MAGFYPTSSAQADALSASYIEDQKFVSYSDSPIINGNMMMYLNPASSTGSFSEISPGNSMSTMAGRNEMMFIPPTGDSMSMQNISGQLNTRTTDNTPNSVAEEFHLASSSQLSAIDGERNLHGLSLSLSTQMSTAVPPNSYQHQFYNSGLSPVLTTHLPLGGENSCRPVTGKVDEASHSKDLRNSGYGSYELQGEGQASIRFGAPSHLQYMVNPKTVGFNAYQYEQAGNASSVLKSKYLKAAQLLLDEVVNVREALKQHESGRDENNNNKVEEGSTESKEKPMGAPDVNDSTAASSQEISAAERQDLQTKLDKLLAMLDEVDRRYKQYFHQMQILVSSFDMVAGCGAAKPYTTLALKTISRHFRCLRDAISGQIQATRKSLGEQDSGPGGVIPRLRYVDQQIRQQRALQQFGMMRHAWRPQRGLPENAVTVLRAWLFEHFLHPYPKDSEKTMLARQTGLTRGQVANWFINARVRLWKPMVEEMYKEEFGDGDLNSKSSPENASKTAGEKSWASEDRREDLQESIASMADSGHPGATHDESKANMNYHAAEMDRFAGRTGMIMGFHQGDNKHREQIKSQVEGQQSYLDSHSFYPHDQNALMGYQVPEPGGYAMNNQVSLALGLRRVEGDGGDGSNGPTENNGIGPGSAEYAYLDSVNQQQRFGSSHLLNDFVV